MFVDLSGTLGENNNDAGKQSVCFTECQLLIKRERERKSFSTFLAAVQKWVAKIKVVYDLEGEGGRGTSKEKFRGATIKEKMLTP